MRHGHSSITATQRYCHPQDDTIQGAFATLASSSKVMIESSDTLNALVE